MEAISPIAQRRRILVVLCLASAGWGFSFGLGVQLGALWLSDAGCDASTVGFSTSIYYLGVAAASPLLPWLMRRSRRGVIVAGMIADGITTALFPWVSGIYAWNLIRILSGVSTALCLIPMETRVNENADPARRARDFGIYAFSVALGVGLGPVLGLLLYDVAPRLAFGIGGGVALAMAGLVAVALPRGKRAVEDEKSDGALPLGAALFSLGTGWTQGFLEGCMLTFMSAYLLGLGYTTDGTSVLLGALFLGVVLFQIPGAMLADRLGRVRILLACHAVILLGLVFLPWCAGAVTLSGLLFIVGACSAALYPLGLALLGESVPPGAMAKANAWYLVCNCLGSVMGPWATGKAIDLYGQRSIFAVAAASVLIAVGLWAAGRLVGLRGGSRETQSSSTPTDQRDAA